MDKTITEIPPRGDGDAQSSIKFSQGIPSGSVGPKGNPTKVFPRQVKSATTGSTGLSLTDSLKRQKTSVLQSVNSRLNTANLVDPKFSNNSVFVKQSGLPIHSIGSIMTDIEDETSHESKKISESQKCPQIKNRAYSTAHVNLTKDEKGIDYSVKNPTQLLFHESENPNVDDFLEKNRKGSLTKYETRNLPPFLIGKNMNAIDDESEWKILFNLIQQSLSEQNSKIVIAVLGWITYTVTQSASFSKEIWNQSNFVSFCARQIKVSNEHRGRYSKILATAAKCGEKKIDFHHPQFEKNFREALSSMCDALREQFSRGGKQKIHILPSLGQLLILAARYDEKDDDQSQTERPKSSTLTKIEQSSSVLCPPPCFSLVVRCLGQNEESQIQLLASTIIELHVYISPRSRFAQSGADAALSLWRMAATSNGESLKVSALSAMSQIVLVSSTQAVQIFDKVGQTVILEFLAYGSAKVQSLLLCLMGTVLSPNIRSSSTSRAAATRLCQNKDTMAKVIKLTDSNSPLVRSKSFLILNLIINVQPELLLHACKSKIITAVEREGKRKLSRYGERCRNILISSIATHIPEIVFTSLECLAEASGRKHPTQPQIKLLKEKLPELQVLPHLISSNAFRQNILDQDFLEGISNLAKYGCDASVKLANSLGDGIWRGFIESIISVIEVVCNRPELLEKYSFIIIPNALPLLIGLLATDKNSGSKLLYIKLINDLLEIIIEKREHGEDTIQISFSEDNKIGLVDEISTLLLNEAPLPVFCLRLFYQLIMYSYDDFAGLIPKSGILEVLITFVEMQSTEQSNLQLQKQLYPLLSLLWEKGDLDTIFILLTPENDFTQVLNNNSII